MSENAIFLSPKDVEHFLKRERDEHGKESYWWRSLDEALDAFRLHMVTGTPLTEPRPGGGPEAFGVGKEPLTEAEELRAEVERLTAERDSAARAAQHLGKTVDNLTEVIHHAIRTATTLDDPAAGIRYLTGYMGEANMLPAESSSPSEEQA